MIAIGLMSGTSLDGVDAALVNLVPRGDGYTIELLDFVTQPFDAELDPQLRAALRTGTLTAENLARLHRDLGRAFARAAFAVRANSKVDFVASHGQTLWHDGERNITLQIGDPFAIREALHATVCYDFRSADTAAGGCGAPLVPCVDAMLLGCADEERVAVNIGGIANITVLPRGVRRDASGGYDLVAFDTGPGTMLLDAFVRGRTNGAERIDRDGALAARGTVDQALLDAMLGDPYFSQPAPKSTGRERFGEHFVAQHYRALDALDLPDGASTLTELTAASIAGAIRENAAGASRVIVSGGGARNPTLLARLCARLSGVRVETSDAMGIDADAKEAIAFAILGYETLRGRASNVPRATGAVRALPLGAIVPHELARLLARIEAECLR
jgi:anhydro-N-acetylmuramic acid kinase